MSDAEVAVHVFRKLESEDFRVLHVIEAAMSKREFVPKEEDVYDAVHPAGSRLAVKFHRLGRISFRQTRRKRAYTAEHAGWLFQSRLAAGEEIQAPKPVYHRGVAVP